MFEKEAEEIANKKLCSKRICYNRCNFNSPKHHRCGEWHRCYESAKDGATLAYNKALEDIMAKVKDYGLISSEACYSDVFDYENNRISEDELWDRFENNAQRELSMVITDMRIEERE